MPFECTAEEGS